MCCSQAFDMMVSTRLVNKDEKMKEELISYKQLSNYAAYELPTQRHAEFASILMREYRQRKGVAHVPYNLN
jgi:hypothetical protein